MSLPGKERVPPVLTLSQDLSVPLGGSCTIYEIFLYRLFRPREDSLNIDSVGTVGVNVFPNCSTIRNTRFTLHSVKVTPIITPETYETILARLTGTDQ